MKVIYLTHALLVLWLCTFAVIMYWLIYPYKILVIKTQPYHVVKPSIAPGETFEFKLDLCKYGDYKATVIYQFISNGSIYGEVRNDSNLTPGCYQQTSYTIKVPGLPDGKYKVKITSVYRPNPFREVRVPAETEEFSVVNPKLLPEPEPTTTPAAQPLFQTSSFRATPRPSATPYSPQPVNSPNSSSTVNPPPQTIQVTQQTTTAPQPTATPQPTPPPEESGNRPGILEDISDLLLNLL